MSRSVVTFVTLSLSIIVNANNSHAQEVSPTEPAPPYSSEIGEGNITGGTGNIALDSVARIVRGQARGFAACFDRELPLRSTVSQRLEVSFTIGENGRVTHVSTGAQRTAPGLGTCVSGRVRGLVFPTPENGPVELSFPLRFTPLPPRSMVRSLVDVQGQMCLLRASPSLRCVPIENGSTQDLDLRAVGEVARVVARDNTVCLTDVAGTHRCCGWMPVDMDPPEGSGPFVLNVSGGELLPPAMGVNGFGADPLVLLQGALTPTSILREGVPSAPVATSPGALLQADQNARTTCWVEGDHTVSCRSGGRALAVADTAGAQEVRLGRNHACARLADGVVRCWEVCASSEADRESATCRSLNRAAPGSRLRSFPVRLSIPAQQLVAQEFESCARLSDGSVSCWTFERRGPSRPVPQTNIDHVRLLSQSGRCLLQEDGTAWCRTGLPPRWRTVEY